jgi:hypothetical protein
MPARMLPRSHPSRIRARLGYQLTRLPVVPTGAHAVGRSGHPLVKPKQPIVRRRPNLDIGLLGY